MSDKLTAFKDWYGVGWDSSAAIDARDTWEAAIATTDAAIAALILVLKRVTSSGLTEYNYHKFMSDPDNYIRVALEKYDK